MHSSRPSLKPVRDWREHRRETRDEKQRRNAEKIAAQQQALRGRDEHTGGYGDPRR